MFKSLGDKIATLRKEARMTQEQLSGKIGVSRPALVKIENSQRAISLDEGDAISKALGISIDTLMNIDDKQEEKTFVMAFKAKGMASDNIDEIAKYELLFDAFITQEQIHRGE